MLELLEVYPWVGAALAFFALIGFSLLLTREWLWKGIGFIITSPIIIPFLLYLAIEEGINGRKRLKVVRKQRDTIEGLMTVLQSKFCCDNDRWEAALEIYRKGKS